MFTVSFVDYYKKFFLFGNNQSKRNEYHATFGTNLSLNDLQLGYEEDVLFFVNKRIKKKQNNFFK